MEKFLQGHLKNTLNMNNSILKMIESRLRVGAEKYGEEINPLDGRDWLEEAIQECADQLVYLCTEKLKRDKTDSLIGKDY